MNVLTKEQLKEMINKKEDFVLINVLSKESFEEEHIPMSINIPLDEKSFEKNVNKKIPNKNRKIVVYCGSFECQASPKAAKKLTEMGYINVRNFPPV